MRLGPIDHALLVVPDLAAAVRGYREVLGLCVVDQGTLPERDALDLGAASLAGASVARLASTPTGQPWLRLIEDCDVAKPTPFSRRGWMALEVLVRDVDALYPVVRDAGWQILGEPADLDVSDAIRAMQVVGPAGEVWYLTEVKRPVPPFNLPLSAAAAAPVSELFVAVLGCADRASSLGFYSGLGVLDSWRFETKLGALNRCQQLPEAQRHPIGVLQLDGAHLIEVDALPTLPAVSGRDGFLPSGIALIAFRRGHADQLPAPTALMRGPDSELIQLLAG